MPRRPPRVLLVEDNEMDIRLVREALREFNDALELDVVRSGTEALDFLFRRGSHEAAETPNIVLLDLNLPGVGGVEVLKRLKANPELRRIPVCILSTSAQKADVLACYDAQANCYLTKSGSFDSFLNTLSRVRDFWLREVHLPPCGGWGPTRV